MSSVVATIDPARVDAIFRDCLFNSDEIVDGAAPPDAVIAEGVMSKFGLHPGRLAGHRTEVVSLLAMLPREFMKSGGGGWTFLNVCQTRDGLLWTGEHRVAEALVALGVGLGLVSYLMPREMWSALPGGMPYLQINDKAF